MDLWICASVQYGNERMPVWEGRESAIFVFIYYMFSPFFYFHIHTHTVFIRHYLMPAMIL